MSRTEDLVADLIDMAEGDEIAKLHHLGRFGWLLTAGRHYPDDGFLDEESVDLLAQGENIWAKSLKVEHERLSFVRAWIDAKQEERNLGLGIYCCIKLIACDFKSDDEAIVLFRVACERYAYAIASHGSGKNPAAEMANLRHAENRELIRDAVKHWREKIDPSLSAQKAATELTKIVPLSHKKLAEIVSKAKKGVRFDD
ncbi:hypothetical protein [Burkholderia lata]|uniref:hypothetical protein n=1 Tax=Burkholderia lata (strain ATCC 17760 / DSM 23089 / LMG 22485 / NCIMB 9086 / R18194 / 383) TaxID=482957 RepID=UPI0015830F55|nr:hypothetical protein [Burkholderia lata]